MLPKSERREFVSRHEGKYEELCETCRCRLDCGGDTWDGLCPTCADIVSEFLDLIGIQDDERDSVTDFARKMISRVRPPGRVLRVPTYYGNAYPDAVSSDLIPEFGKPLVPIRIDRVDGIKVQLGLKTGSEDDPPDVQFERRPHGWAIFLHPVGGSDPSGFIYFHDDGRSFVVLENDVGTTPRMKVSEWDEAVAAVDHTS